MEKISHLTLSCLLIFLSNIACASFVLYSKPFTITKKIWILCCFTVSVWSLSLVNANFTHVYSEALFGWRLGNLAALFIPVLFFHFVLLLTEQQNKNQKQLKLYYAITITYFFISLFFPDLFVDTVKPKAFTPYYAHSGAIYPFFFFMYISIFFLGLSMLFRSYKTASASKKNQYKFVFIGIFVGAVSGGSTFLPVFDIDINPLLNYLTPGYIIAVSYAIMKHQLMDIQIVIRKSAVYTFLAASISLLYLLIVLGLEKVFQTWFGYKSPKISIATAFVIGLLAVPLRQRIQAFVDQYFFKGTHQEIASQNEQLRHEIAKSEKYKTISTLASGVAHEIKNPLTSVKTFCEYLPQKLNDKEFLLKFSRLVGREVERIDAMIHELLDYGKPAPLSLKETNIQRLITDTMDLLSNKFLAQHISVTQNLSPDNYHLKIDPARVKQALLNLFLNAIEAMPGGGKLTVSSFVERTSYIVTITDTGCGIPPEDLKRVFDPFFSGKDRGTGLGLAIVQGIMEQHQGKVRIESAVGVGTEVRLEFPLKRENTLNFA